MLAPLVLPVPLAARVPGVQLRRADPADLAPLMELLADDAVSAS
ncbi:GNAT family N-acetyltransferase, partial [Clavibacter californiensis]